MKRRPRSREPAAVIPPLADWLRAAVEHSPTAVGIVRGKEYTLAYANAAFHELSAVNGAHTGAVVDRQLCQVYNAATAKSLTALLDRARQEGKPVHARLAASEMGASNALYCRAWPTSACGNASLNESHPLVVEVDASAQWKQEETQHRALTELALLGAIREEARADEADAALSRAEQARALRDDFLAEVSHEMRTPLQAILTHVRLIELGEYGTVNKEGMEALTAIRGGMRHVVALIGELQQYGSSAERRIEYSIARVNVETAVLTAVSLVAPQAHAKGIGLTITAEAPCPAVAADAAKLLQILLNLLSNAVKFTGAGGSITVSCEPKLGDDALVRAVAIHVADTGRGIASNQIPLVFVPYVQVGAQSSEVDRGVGLGLSISRALAAGMGGDLMARSTPGSGSVFTLTMPSV